MDTCVLAMLIAGCLQHPADDHFSRENATELQAQISWLAAAPAVVINTALAKNNDEARMATCPVELL